MSRIDCETSIDEEYVGYFITEVASSASWLGREVSKEELDDLSLVFKEAIQETLDNYDEESEEFYRLTVTLEEIGDTVDDETIDNLGLRTFVELVLDEEDEEEALAFIANRECGFWSNMAKVWKKHKKVILIGAAVIIVTAVILGTGGAAGAAAGTGAKISADDKKKSSPKVPPTPASLPLPPSVTSTTPLVQTVIPSSHPIIEGFPLTASAPVYTPPSLLPEIPSFTPNVSLTNNNAPYLPISPIANPVPLKV